MLSAAAAMAQAPTASPKSSLEVLLETIQRGDEQHRDEPPALPARPTCRGRLPTSRRPSLPSGFKLENGVAEEATALIDKEPDVDKGIAVLEAKEEMVVKGRIFGTKSKFSSAEVLDESPCIANIPENRKGAVVLKDPPSVSSATEKMNGKPVCADIKDYVLQKIVVLDNSKNQMLPGIVCIQKHFRGLHSRQGYQELKKGAMALQSFIRGERARIRFGCLVKRWKAAILIQKYIRRRLAATMFNDQLKHIILLQSVMRGCLARKKYQCLKNEKDSKVTRKVQGDARNSISELREANGHAHQPAITELQGRILKAETALKDKEEENVMLKQQLEQYEKKWSEYEDKMKSMEEAWKRQLSSLQLSLVAAKKSLASDEVATRVARSDATPTHAQYDSEDTLSTGTHTPEAVEWKHQNYHPESKVSAGNSDRRVNVVNHLATEFEDRRRVFEDDAGFLVAVKSGQIGSNMNPDEELRKLKDRFATWKKDYKSRLKETKVNLQKVGTHDEKSRKRWWGKKSSK